MFEQKNFYLSKRTNDQSMIFLIFCFTFFLIFGVSYAETDLYDLSLKKQIELDVDLDKINCKDNLKLIIKKNNDMPACVKPETYKKLLERNWGIEQNFSELKSNAKTDQWLILKSDKKFISDPSMIVWSENKTLSWTDFNGTIQKNPKSIAYANTFIDYSYTIESVPSSECKFVFSQISTQALFVSFNSWYKHGQQTDPFLKHEQGHFDIAQINAQKLKQNMENQLKSKYLDCASVTFSNDKITRMEYVAKQLTNNIYDNFISSWHDMDEKYDLETSTGTNHEKQKQWNQFFDSTLRKEQ